MLQDFPHLPGLGIHGGLRFVAGPHGLAARSSAAAAGRRGPGTARRQAAGAGARWSPWSRENE